MFLIVFKNNYHMYFEGYSLVCKGIPYFAAICFLLNLYVKKSLVWLPFGFWEEGSIAVKYSVEIPLEHSAWEMVLNDPWGVFILLLLYIACETKIRGLLK